MVLLDTGVLCDKFYLLTRFFLPLFSSPFPRYVHAFSVDNAIGKVADPVFIGYSVSKGSDLGNKVVWKCEPGEKVGVVGKRGGKYVQEKRSEEV